MPGREPGTYDDKARRVTSTSDVSNERKTRANTGSTAAAGVVSGALQIGRQGESSDEFMH